MMIVVKLGQTLELKTDLKRLSRNVRTLGMQTATTSMTM